MDELLSVNELAALLKFHRRTVERMATAEEATAEDAERRRQRNPSRPEPAKAGA